MSAYVVDRNHIRCLVEYALMHGLTWVWNVKHEPTSYDRGRLERADYKGAARMGQRLWDANVASVLCRYPGEAGDLPGPTDEAPYVYSVHAPSMVTPSPEAIIGACGCYEYQACESPIYAESEAHAIIEAIRREACRRLKGADWGAPDMGSTSVVALSQLMDG